MQGKQQLCMHLLYESLFGQCQYKTQHKGSFLCHVMDTKSGIVILINKFVLFLLHSHLGKW